jgi:hypothetical protein
MVRERGFQKNATIQWNEPLSPTLSPLVPRREREQVTSAMVGVSRCARVRLSRHLASVCGCNGSHLGCRRGRHFAARNRHSARGSDGEARTIIRRPGPVLRSTALSSDDAAKDRRQSAAGPNPPWYCGGWMPGSTAGGMPAATLNRYSPTGEGLQFESFLTGHC